MHLCTLILVAKNIYFTCMISAFLCILFDARYEINMHVLLCVSQTPNLFIL
jgi:hypothetical protein